MLCYLLCSSYIQNVGKEKSYLHTCVHTVEAHMHCMWFSNCFAWTAGWRWYLVYPVVLWAREWHCCWERSVPLVRGTTWATAALCILCLEAWSTPQVHLKHSYHLGLCSPANTTTTLFMPSPSCLASPSLLQPILQGLYSTCREKLTDNRRDYLSVVKSIAYSLCLFGHYL